MCPNAAATVGGFPERTAPKIPWIPWLSLAGWWYTYPRETYEFVNGKDDIPYMKWKINAMFETTNQTTLVRNLPVFCLYYGQPLCQKPYDGLALAKITPTGFKHG